jgi:hypothetical protein
MSSKNNHNKNLGSNIERTNDRISETGEVFTPPEVIQKLLSDIPEEVLKNPESKFLDNSAGNGNFIVELKKTLIKYHSEEHVVENMLYAVELMEDNHKELCQRVGVSTTHPHYVNTDALTYHYRFDGTIGPLTLDHFFN